MVFQGLPVPMYVEPELPIELLQQGWKKFWSKRENRPYFWNKLTGESLWEFPAFRPHVCMHHNYNVMLFYKIYFLV